MYKSDYLNSKTLGLICSSVYDKAIYLINKFGLALAARLLDFNNDKQFEEFLLVASYVLGKPTINFDELRSQYKSVSGKVFTVDKGGLYISGTILERYGFQEGDIVSVSPESPPGYLVLEKKEEVKKKSYGLRTTISVPKQ